MESESPYLSLVVTTRNDDHGGDLLERTQAFINGWLAQSRRSGLTSELIIVEWNPPAGRPRLREALNWPADLGPCEVRFVEVPEAVHRRYAHAEVLPLYQMIAKNAGIRRSRGRFVLATNIDILFSDELVDFLADRRLEGRRMYRIDRHDVMSGVLHFSTLDQQLAYCRNHLLRVNAREGIFQTTPEGQRTVEAEDIATSGSGIEFGPGWFPVECEFEYEAFRWVGQKSELRIDLPAAEGRQLTFDLEPGPGTGRKPLQLDLIDEDGRVLATTSLNGRRNWQVDVPPASRSPRILSLRSVGGGRLSGQDPRNVSFRVFWCGWEGTRPQETTAAFFKRGVGRKCVLLWRKLQNVVSKVANEGPMVTFTVLIPAKVQRLARLYFDWGGIAGLGGNLVNLLSRRRKFPQLGTTGELVDPRSGIVLGNGWGGLERVRGESFRRVHGSPELVLPPTAAETSVLSLLIEPERHHRVSDLRLRNQHGAVVASGTCQALEWVKLEVPRRPGKTEVFRLDFGGPTAAFRLFRCGLEGAPAERNGGSLRIGGQGSVCRSATLGHRTELVVTAPEGRLSPLFLSLRSAGDIPVALQVVDDVGVVVSSHTITGSMTVITNLPMRRGGTSVFILQTGSPDQALTVLDCGWNEPKAAQPEFFLHTNACGDFTMMSRQDWFDLRAYPEFDLYSMHIDSVFCYAAHLAGVRETMLADPMRVYHIEHAAGSGWTPEGESILFGRLEARGLSFLSYPDLMGMIAQMWNLNCPMIFNRGNWGLSEFELPESTLGGSNQ